MITYITKVPNKTLARTTGYGLLRLNGSVRNYANTPHPSKKISTGTGYTIGAITLLSTFTIGYAKYDPNFRKWLNENVPGAGEFLRFLFQEEKTFDESFTSALQNIKYMIVGDPAQKKRENASDISKEYQPPRPIFPTLVTKDAKEETYSEIRIQNPQGIDTVKEKPKNVSKEVGPVSLADLEIKITNSATRTIKAYDDAKKAFQAYVREVDIIIEQSIERMDKSMWEKLQEKTEKKNEVLKEAETIAKETSKEIDRFKCLIDDAKLEGSETAKATAKRNADRLNTDIRAARDRYEQEKSRADITDKYWRKVSEARCYFIHELEILFPNFDINKKKMSLKPSELDLFVVHAFKHVINYQKEVQRLEKIVQSRLNQAIEQIRKNDPDFDIREVMIREEIDAKKRDLENQFQKKCLALRKESERELRHRLKCQEQAHVDHLQDVVATKEAEMDRDFNRKLDERMQEEKGKYKEQMAGMVARMTGMKNAIHERMVADRIAHQSQVLWSACQALYRAVKNTQPGVPLNEQIRPLQCELDAIKKSAVDNDELVQTVIAAVPFEARTRGVFPEGALRERFLKVERAARRLALVPCEGARLPLYLLSFLQATLLTSAANPIPQEELEDKIVDFSKLNTYDILQRARYWIDRGNYAQTLKYMNLLKGASRCIAAEWMREARILLETQQAAETLMAHAVATGLLHL